MSLAGTAVSLLLCAFLVRGLQSGVEMVRCETAEAVVGQNVTLRCVVRTNPPNVVSVEWRKKASGDVKLAVISPNLGRHLVRPNVTVRIENDDGNLSTSFYLRLPEVEMWDAGVYVCDIATFPLGSIRREIELKVKDADVTCDAGGRVDVRAGENVTIHCRAPPDAQYRWSKNKELVSESGSLTLLQVTDGDAGVYTLTVHTGRRSLHREVNVTVQTATPTDATPVSPHSNLTEEAWQKPAEVNVTVSSTAVTSSVTDAHPNASRVHTTAGGHEAHWKSTHAAVTPPTATPTTTPLAAPTATPTDMNVLLNTTASTPFTASFSGVMNNQSSPHTATPRDILSVRPESRTTGVNTETYERAATTQTPTTGNKDATRSHQMVWIIIPVVVVAVAGFLYRRRIIKQRMALPPPFKPPPPPVKYTAVRHHVTPTQPFPIAKCNSVTEGGGRYEFLLRDIE